MPKVSVIVPFYNVDGYIEKCLETLVNQTLKDIEIILVNDGSKDRSIDIVKKFLKQYPEKIVYLEKDMYQLMYDMAQKEKSDMVECDFFWNYPDKVKTDIGEKYKIQLEYLYARYAFCSSLLRMVKIQNEEV